MKRTVYFPEIFAMVGEAKTEEEKIAILHKYSGVKGFYDIIKLCYDDNIKWMVTREDIENLVYDHMDIADFDLAPETLFNLARRQLYNFTNMRKGNPLTKRKITLNIARHFSVLHHEEIELFKQMIDGNIEEDGINKDLINKAFPNLLPISDDEDNNDTSSEEPAKEKKVIVRKSKLDKHKKKIFAMLESGSTRKDVAKKYKVADPTLYNWLRKNKE